MLLVDGSLTAAAPLDQALAADAGSIVLFDTGASAVPEEAVPHLRWWQMAALAYNHQIRGQLGHALLRVAARIPVVTFTTAEGPQLDFTQPLTSCSRPVALLLRALWPMGSAPTWTAPASTAFRSDTSRIPAWWTWFAPDCHNFATRAL